MSDADLLRRAGLRLRKRTDAERRVASLLHTIAIWAEDGTDHMEPRVALSVRQHAEALARAILEFEDLL